MLQDISPSVYHNEYRPVPPLPGDMVFVFRGRTVLSKMSEDHVYEFPEVSCLSSDPAELFTSGALIWLFRIDDRSYFLLDEGKVLAGESGEKILKGSAQGYSFEKIWFLRRLHPQPLCFAAVTAFHLYNWYTGNRFCACCGRPMKMYEGGERALICSDASCARIVYPRINPAVITAVTFKDRILVTHYKGREYSGPSLVAGFCEIGERVEDTVRREVLEETGLRVDNIRYFGSQPWGFDGGVLLGFFCDAADPESVRADGEELADAVWVRAGDITSDETLDHVEEKRIPLDDANGGYRLLIRTPKAPVSLTATMIRSFTGAVLPRTS